jgi:hypothetical protein
MLTAFSVFFARAGLFEGRATVTFFLSVGAAGGAVAEGAGTFVGRGLRLIAASKD